ncbi:MAG: TetR/AcrR family transcriptional regulator [Luteimonas sp.]
MSSTPAPDRGPAEHDVRTQIIVAAREHFSQFGYEKTTVSDLAKAIGFSKAYVYKFFESKQGIGEQICASCLVGIEAEVRAAVSSVDTPSDRMRQMFSTLVEASVRLFVDDKRLYEIAASAAGERWQSAIDYEARIRGMLEEIVVEGRLRGEFERKTPLDETVQAIYLVMRPYLNPLLLRHSIEHSSDAPARLTSLVLRSLSP